MQAIKLGKKYPDFKQDEIFDLINKFKWVLKALPSPLRCSSALSLGLDELWTRPSYWLLMGNSFLRQIDVDDKGSLDKATVISALQANGEADYDSVSRLFFAINKPMHFHTMVL